MSAINYLRIFSDADGCSHFDFPEIELQTNDYAPPAPALNTSSKQAADHCMFLELPVGWYGDWHPTPVRQWLVLMSGECEFAAGDGEVRRRKAGDVVLLDDTTGKGHRTTVVGETPVRIAAIHLP